MKYSFHYKVKISDLWQASMYYAYSSYLAVVNLVCIVSGITAFIALWNSDQTVIKILMALFVLLFVAVQPLSMLKRSAMQLRGREIIIDLTLDERGMTVSSDGENAFFSYEKILNVAVKPTIVVIYTSQGQGYILNNRVLGNDRADVVRLLRSKWRREKASEK